MAKRKAFLVYHDTIESVKMLTDAQAGQLYKAQLEYANGMDVTVTDPIANILFSMLKSQMDRDVQKYEEKCIKNQANIKKRWGKADLEPEKMQETKRAEPVQEESRNIPEKKKKPVRHHYGIYKNVLLSDKDLETLKAEFPSNWEEWINKVDAYVQSHGKKYTDYLATIRNWARDEKPKTNTAERNKFDDPRQRENYGFIDEQLLSIVQG